LGGEVGSSLLFTYIKVMKKRKELIKLLEGMIVELEKFDDSTFENWSVDGFVESLEESILEMREELDE